MRVSLILLTWAAYCVAGEPAPSTIVRDGSSYEKAVIINAPMSKYVDLEWKWIAQHYPGARMVPGESGTSVDRHGRWFAAVTFTTANGKPKTGYFDITGVK
jgi:hypothetical protein